MLSLPTSPSILSISFLRSIRLLAFEHLQSLIIPAFKIIGPKIKYPISKYVSINISDKCFLILHTAFSCSLLIFPHLRKEKIIFFLWVNKIRILLRTIFLHLNFLTSINLYHPKIIINCTKYPTRTNTIPSHLV